MSMIDWHAAVGFMLYGVGLIGLVFYPQCGENAFG